MAQVTAGNTPRCADVVFSAGDYRDTPVGDLYYCDCPYVGTMGYDAVEPWDPKPFWAWARKTSSRCLLAVSEIEAPPDFVPLLSFSLQHRIHTGSGKRRIEHLFVPKAQLGAWQVDGPLFAKA